MMQFHIVQLGRYSSAITRYTGAQTTNTTYQEKTPNPREWELSFVQALEWLGCGLCQWN